MIVVFVYIGDIMISEYLMNAYDEYKRDKTYTTLIEFAEKTFPKNGTSNLFIGCALILITTICNKYYATTNAMLSVLECGKEKIGDTNLLKIYYERINGNKDVSKYLKKEFDNPKYEENLDMLIDYYRGWIYDYKKILYDECKDKLNDYKKDEK